MTNQILLIDDNVDDLEYYTDLLSQVGDDYIIHTAGSAEEAIPIFSNHDIHCTFIDYNLPGENGLKILEMLSDLVEGKVLPAVILTGEPHQSIQAEAARRGALDYIVKSTASTPGQLKAVIDKTTEWAKALSSQ